MSKKQFMKNIVISIIDGDQDKIQESARDALKANVDPLEVVELGLSKGMAIVGESFEQGESFLPELLMAAATFNAAMEILMPEIEAQNKEIPKAGTVLIGTVKGDVHNLGKNIVSMVLETNGFSVVDIGVDVPSLNFIEEARKVKADVIALSSLMTTTMPSQKEIIEILEEKNLRNEYFVIVGGGPVSQQWADEIGADGFGKTAVDAVDLIKRLLSQRD
jgi:corrinoid protein of di/trimethylamine methyltransferase